MTDAATHRGRVALVTGGSRGVGKGIAEALGGAGATVYVTGRTVAETEFGASCIPIPCDHTDDDQVERAFDRIHSDWSAQKHIANVPYGVSKAATDKMTYDMAHELREHGVAVVSLYPGLVRTEKVMEAAAYLDLSNSESPQLIGPAVAALMNDPNILALSGARSWRGRLSARRRPVSAPRSARGSRRSAIRGPLSEARWRERRIGTFFPNPVHDAIV